MGQLVLLQNVRRRGTALQIVGGVQGGVAGLVLAQLPAQPRGVLQLLLGQLQLPELLVQHQGQITLPLLERLYLLHGEPELPQQLDFQQRVHILLGVFPVPVLPPDGGNKALTFVVADVGPHQLRAALDLFDGHKNTSFVWIISCQGALQSRKICKKG